MEHGPNTRSENRKDRRVAVTATSVIGVILLFIASSVAAISTAGAETQPRWVYVCKYVGTPGDGERLQTGQNPIRVSANSTDGAGIGGLFNDAQGRSLVIADAGTPPNWLPEPALGCPETPPGGTTTTTKPPKTTTTTTTKPPKTTTTTTTTTKPPTTTTTTKPPVTTTTTKPPVTTTTTKPPVTTTTTKPPVTTTTTKPPVTTTTTKPPVMTTTTTATSTTKTSPAGPVAAPTDLTSPPFAQGLAGAALAGMALAALGLALRRRGAQH